MIPEMNGPRRTADRRMTYPAGRAPPDLPDDLRRFLLTYPYWMHGILQREVQYCEVCGDAIEPGQTIFWTMYHNTPLTPVCHRCGTAFDLASGRLPPDGEGILPAFGGGVGPQAGPT